MTEEMNKDLHDEVTEAELDDALAEAEKRSAKGDRKAAFKKLDELGCQIAALEAEIAGNKQELADLQKSMTEQGDKYLRLAAEYDNYRRRSKEEQDRIYGDAYAAALAALFPVVDNLERASQFSDGENVAKGVAMTLKSVAETLERLGVKEIEALGKPFDPQYHNAVFHVEDEAFGESEVVEVLQKGYIMGERVLRYAMVKVAN
ncbi:MAG: nucleotide exchange factor GrpE [Clostridia bacterium]|nr:nucleotide exchange factor GrpE [Clostridia bacterium]